MQIETQNEKPTAEYNLFEVGIKDLKTFVVLERNGVHYHLVPTVEVSFDLPKDIRGAHMSRIIESISEIITKRKIRPSVELMQIDILKALRKRHTFNRGRVSFRFDYGYNSVTPVSHKKTWEICTIQSETTVDENEEYIHRVTVEVIGNTACPHAMANNQGKTHIQRAIGKLTVIGKENMIPDYEDMIEVVEASFSSRTYTLLKTDDEKYIVNQMYSNPFFVEDLCRNILENSERKFKGRKLEICSEAISFESIHKHNVIARGKTRVK